MRAPTLAVLFSLLVVGLCFKVVQPVDDFQSVLVVSIELDGSCGAPCAIPGSTAIRSASQILAQPGEYIIPGRNYVSPTFAGRMDSRELFIQSSDPIIPYAGIQTLTEAGKWKIVFPSPEAGVNSRFQSFLTYDGVTTNPTSYDPFYYDYAALSIDLTNPGSFSLGNPAALPPAFGFRLRATTDLTSTFFFRVITDTQRGSQLKVTIPQGVNIDFFAPFYLFKAIPAGDAGIDGLGQHTGMLGVQADFTDVSILSFVFETTDAVDAELSLVSLVSGAIRVRVFLDCSPQPCLFDGSDTLLTGVTLSISGRPSSAVTFPISTITYEDEVIVPGRNTLDDEGYWTFYVDEGSYEICVGNIPAGVSLLSAPTCAGKSADGCYDAIVSTSNGFPDVVIDIPATSTLSITPPPATSVDCRVASTATSTVFTLSATATGCGTVATPTFQDSITNGCSGSFTITRTWSVTQGTQTRTANQLITVFDSTPPQIGSVINTSVNCGACTTTAANCLGAPVVSDSCAIGTIFASSAQNSVGDSCVRTFTRTWNAVDPCGNNATPVIQTFTVTDRDSPSFNGGDPADNGTVPCGGSFVFATLFATDPCQSVASVTTADQTTDVGCIISVRRVYTANDGCGNTATVDQILTSSNAGTPSLSDPADLNNVPCTSSLTPTALQSTAVATDSCTRATIPGVTFNDINNPFSTPPHQLGSTCPRSFERVWSIATPCGGSATVSQIITIRDNTLPRFSSFVTSPPPVQCASNQCTCSGAAPVPVAVDDCSNVSTPTFRDVNNSGDSCITTTTRVWTATDACGNSVTDNQFLVREDRAAPIVTLPFPTITYPCVGSIVPTPTSGEFPTVIDCQTNVNPIPSTPVRNNAASNNCDSVFTRVWNVNDGCGNTASVSQTVIVRDSTPPTFRTPFPANTSVDCLVAATATSPTGNNRPNADDACTEPTLTFSESTSGDLCPNGIQLTRTWTATDVCGLSTSRSQIFTITNTNDPTITVRPTTITVNCDAPTLPSDLNSTAEDDSPCDINTTITFFDVLTTGCPSIITRTFVVTDDCNRRASVTQTIRLLDNVDPVFTFFPEDVGISCADSVDPDVDTGTPTVSDNCDSNPTLTPSDRIIAGSIGPGLCPGDDVTIRTWTVTDRCGNSFSQEQTITISNRPPDECDPVECIPQPCDTSSCPVPNCDCCGAPAVNCLPVNCNPQPCNPVDCTPVPCSGCDIDIAVTGCQPRTCPPRYVYVDDDDIENFQKAQPAQANPKVSGASQLVLSCMLLLASVGSIFVALF